MERCELLHLDPPSFDVQGKTCFSSVPLLEVTFVSVDPMVETLSHILSDMRTPLFRSHCQDNCQPNSSVFNISQHFNELPIRYFIISP